MRVKTGAVRKRAAMIVSVAFTIALAAGVTFAISNQASFTPPPFESRAAVGVPQPPEMLRYTRIDADRFAFMVAGILTQQEDGSLRIYFTNPEENDVYLMCEIFDADGEVIYRSGMLRPGEYVATLSPITIPGNEAVDIRINIYALEPEVFFSAGTVALGNILQPY